MAPPILDSVDKSWLSPDYSCNQVFGICHEFDYQSQSPKGFANRVLSDLPKEVKSNDYHDKLYDMIAKDPHRETLKIALIADPHIDMYYKEGSVANCGSFPICCRGEPATGDQISAG